MFPIGITTPFTKDKDVIALMEGLEVMRSKPTIIYGCGGLDDVLTYEARYNKLLSKESHITKAIAWFRRLSLLLEQGDFVNEDDKKGCHTLIDDLKKAITLFKQHKPKLYNDGINTLLHNGFLPFTTGNDD